MTYKRASWIIVTLWVVFCLATINYNGPFFDEGIYITSGLRTLEGHGLSDNYLTWFAGSLLWPTLAGLGFRYGGLTGARVVGLAFITLALVATMLATGNLFGERARFWAALAFALNGPLLALSRLAVYDTPALAGLAVAFWGVTELARRDHRAWLGLVAGAFVVAFFAKYPSGIMLLPLLAILVLLRRRKALTDTGILGFMLLALGMAFYLPAREQIAQFFAWRLGNKPTFGVTLEMIAFALLYLSAIPVVLAAGGWIAARGRRLLATVLLGSSAIWPAYHLIMEEPTGPNKHILYGFLFAYPLVGLALDKVWGAASGRLLVLRRAFCIALMVPLAIVGLVQMNQNDLGWPDARQAAAYLTEHVQPGETLLINESWPYTMYLYGSGRIQSPWDVYDNYRINNDAAGSDLCAYDWFVDVQASFAWPEDLKAQIQACDRYEQAYSTRSSITGLAPDLSYVTHEVKIVVWKNTR